MVCLVAVVQELTLSGEGPGVGGRRRAAGAGGAADSRPGESD